MQTLQNRLGKAGALPQGFLRPPQSPDPVPADAVELVKAGTSGTALGGEQAAEDTKVVAVRADEGVVVEDAAKVEEVVEVVDATLETSVTLVAAVPTDEELVTVTEPPSVIARWGVTAAAAVVKVARTTLNKGVEDEGVGLCTVVTGGAQKTLGLGDFLISRR